MHLVYENNMHSFIYKEREVCPHGDADYMDQELQHTYDFISCVAHFTFCFVLDKIS